MIARSLHPEALSRDRWFLQLPPHFADALLSLAVPRRLPAGQRVCLRGQRNGGMYCLLKGNVHVLNQLQAEKESFLASFEAPFWFGELGLFDDGPISHDVYTHTACHALFLSRERLLQLLATYPAGWKHIGALQAVKLRLAYFLLDEFSGLATEVRLARRLLAKAGGQGMRTGFQPWVDMSQEMLARSIGVVRSSITPLLQDWRRRGLVDLHYGAVVLSDVPALMRVARYVEWPEVYKELFALPVPPEAYGPERPAAFLQAND